MGKKLPVIEEITPENHVLGWIDLSSLCRLSEHGQDVLNSIAYDADSDRLFVTGKDWPKLYEIKVMAP